MALTDTFVRQVKATEKATGDKFADGAGMYLLVKPDGKYWRLDYTFGGKRKTLALGPSLCSPLRFSGTPVAHRVSPMLGEHSATVLATELGLSEERLEALRERSIV